MQSNLQSQDGIIAQFLHLRIAGNRRQVLHSLIVAGSLGALFGNPAFASSASREPEPAERNQGAHSLRTVTGNQPNLSHLPSLNGKSR